MTLLEPTVTVSNFRPTRKVIDATRYVEVYQEPTVLGLPLTLARPAICALSVVLAVVTGAMVPLMAHHLSRTWWYLGF